MKTPLTFLLSLTFLFLFSCSDQKSKTKVKQIENPKVKESFENHVTSIIKSFDLKKMKEWGFAPNYDFITGKFDDGFEIVSMPDTSQTEIENKSGYMWGTVMLMGSFKEYDTFLPDFLNLEFVKFSHDEPWRLITYDGQIENYASKDPNDSKRISPPEIQTYIKSKFKTIDNLKRFENPNFRRVFNLDKDGKSFEKFVDK